MRRTLVVALTLLALFAAPHAPTGAAPPARTAPVAQAPATATVGVAGVQLRLPTLSEDLRRPQADRGERVRVIVQADAARLSDLRRQGYRVLRSLTGAVVVEVTRHELDQLAADPTIQHLSGDLPVRPMMTTTNRTTAAVEVWKSTSSLLGLVSQPGVDGSGSVVAVVDSGIAPHKALENRILARVNFAQDDPGAAGDPYGHGTHVAGIVTGARDAARYVTGEYSGGTAPGARVVDVRVLGRDGSGRTSDVIAGIDWVIANRSRYRIRVINLSLGRPVTEPCATDPLCRAVERAVRYGIVVVAAAGNYGRTADGAPILGGITSPGNSPFAITVGALDTRGTWTRDDDVVAPYSSRGPTKFDFGVKPDVVAPGTRVVSLEAPGSRIVTSYPSLHVAGGGRNAYLRLSGTSMASAVVAGGVALLLQAEPSLTPMQVKIALQMGATFMPEAGLIGGGAGSVHFARSRQIAEQGLVETLLDPLLDLLLGDNGGAAFRDAGTLIDRLYGGTGLRLLDRVLADLLWRNADNAEWGVLYLLGLGNRLAGIPPNWLVWGEVAGWTDSYYIVWGSEMRSPDGEYIVWGSSGDSEYIVWGSSGPPAGDP
jgi:serine protease AprX